MRGLQIRRSIGASRLRTHPFDEMGVVLQMLVTDEVIEDVLASP
jgi:hypothetical protein